jgi:hypothetical protein
MADKENGADTPQHPQVTGAVINIILHPGGRLQVNGPVHDKLLCFGMLEAAKQAIIESHVPVAESLPHFLTPREPKVQ